MQQNVVLKAHCERQMKERAIRRVADALIANLRLEPNALMVLRLNAKPAANLVEAVRTFVRQLSEDVDGPTLETRFEATRSALLGRIEELFDPLG